MAKKKKAKKAASRKPRKTQTRKRVTGIKRKPRKRSTGARSSRPRPRSVKIGSVTQHIAIARHGLENQLKDQMLRQYNATTKTAKRQIGKKIAELKSKIQKLK